MSTKKDPVLVIVQLSGGNDFMNTIIPYTHGIYYDSRPVVGLKPEEVLPLHDTLAWNPHTAPLKAMYDAGNVAIVQGIGYPDSNRSHFRAMDIWHTCEPLKIGTEGWVGRVIRELDPRGQNVLTGVSVGKGLPRAMAVAGVPVTSFDNLDTYGLLTGIADEHQRSEALEIFKGMYGSTVGSGIVMDYLAQTGLNVMRGTDELKKAKALYTSTVEYADNGIARSLRDVARVHLAGLGTRVFYTQHGGYDNHANEVPAHPKLLADLSGAISSFFQDLRAHNASEEVTMLVFTEFGRRIRDNASGTDHGTGGGAFIIGDRVKGGLYAEYPSLHPSRWVHGEDLEHTIDFRGIYGTVLEQWMGLDPTAIVGGKFEQIRPYHQAA
ncbi:MAG: DUF1501 domain-containing protein [Caldilineaceae bacterium]